MEAAAPQSRTLRQQRWRHALLTVLGGFIAIGVWFVCLLNAYSFDEALERCFKNSIGFIPVMLVMAAIPWPWRKPRNPPVHDPDQSEA